MAKGYAGKILKIDLTNKKVDTIDTSKYEKWGGGHGMGSALFWDLCEDKTIDGLDPRNVVTIMTSPLSGTLAPGAAGRTEVQAIGIQSMPKGWYTRSNFGGRFSSQLKYAGWDGVVILGKSATPVWINIVNGKVTLEDAKKLWGLDTWETQEEIWASVLGSKPAGDWKSLGTSRDTGRSTQRPAVLTTGPNAEKFGPMAALVHDAGNGAGQGGFGGVFASKNLKAVSVIGTGGVEIADPNALMETRLWLQQNYTISTHFDKPHTSVGNFTLAADPGATSYLPKKLPSRPQGCVGCTRDCRTRTAAGIGNESQCVEYLWYNSHDKKAHGGVATEVAPKAADQLQRLGINAFPMLSLLLWLNALLKQDLLGPGKEINSNLPYSQWGETAFADAITNAIVTQTDIGADIALGVWQCAKKWGRLEKDLKSGILPLQEWGYPHHYDARTEVEWGYGSLMGDRDINEHDFNFPAYWSVSIPLLSGVQPCVPAERMAEIIGKKMVPYSDDPKLLDYSDEGIYSESMAKTVAWHRHYTRYYKQAIGYCDWAWADFLNPYGPDFAGATGEAEHKFINAVTGSNMTFADGIEKGRRIWNLDRAIWVLQGRTRDMEVFADYNFEVGAMPGTTTYEIPYSMPVFENGKWSYKSVAGRKLDRKKVEDWKTRFYTVEGWDTKTGWPTRATLEKLELKNVADALEAAKKLGSA